MSVAGYLITIPFSLLWKSNNDEGGEVLPLANKYI